MFCPMAFVPSLGLFSLASSFSFLYGCCMHTPPIIPKKCLILFSKFTLDFSLIAEAFLNWVEMCQKLFQMGTHRHPDMNVCNPNGYRFGSS